MNETSSWIINTFFCFITALNYILYALTFRQVGQAEISFAYIFSVLTNPLFMLALGMALGASLLRMAVFSAFGVTRSAVVSEMTVIFTLILSFLVFREKLGSRFLIGSVIILIGVYIVSHK